MYDVKKTIFCLSFFIKLTLQITATYTFLSKFMHLTAIMQWNQAE